jgi:small subunit ribosomal protein S17
MAHLLTGVVTSDKPDKTVVISVTTRKTHPLYKKQYTVNTKFMVHDEKNEAKVGDLIAAAETRPLSARKRYILTKVLTKAGAHFEEADATADVPEPEKPAEKPEAKAKPAKEPKPDAKTADDKEGKA